MPLDEMLPHYEREADILRVAVKVTAEQAKGAETQARSPELAKERRQKTVTRDRGVGSRSTSTAA